MQYTHIHSLTILRLRSITKVEIALTAIGILIFGWPTSNACAQVIPNRAAPGSQQPTTLLTANGVPQINIQTPSAAGVSRNLYSQFDVQSNGIILNNSSKNVQTQQAGWIQGNPWLSSGSARIILNEVNAPSPTYLNGYVEVAGQRAEVVIANPSGISVNGGGFINTSKATLTTGLPIVNAGNLEGYRVQGGNVSINGNGLDFSTTDYSAILARAVQVNAGIWANELKVVTGANQIDASSLNPNTAPVTMNIAGSGEAPSMALDVAQIGGMYAGKIHLVGTEQGLGVRNAGVLSASAGNLVLQNNGWLTTTGAIQANGNLQISVQGNITNNGQIFGNHLSMAASSLTNDVEAQSAVKIAPVIAARDRLDLGIKDTLINREHALIYSGGNMFIGGGLDASGNAVGEVSQLNNSSATIEAVGDLSLSSKTLRNTNEHFSTRVDQVSGPSAKSWEVGQFHVDHQTFSYKSVQNEYETKVIGSDPAQILAGGNITLTGDQLINDKSKIIAGAMLSGDLGNLNNIQAMGEHRLTESGTVTTTTHYWQGGLFGRGNYWEEQTTDYKPADVVTSISLPVTYAMDKTTIASSGSASNLAFGSDISNSLYKSNPSLVARYLVETNPVFTNNKLWLSSDYMTQSLDIEPGITQKRLGDGFYEQKLIREQVAEMTGKRYLANYTDDSEEYKALMNGAITFAQTYRLRPGIALTAQQVAQLTSDIVWLEEQSVRLPDGSSQKVLVPKLYLKAQSDDLDGSGALLSGKDIKLNLTGDLTNSGAIAGSKLVSLYAANIHNLSGRVSGGELQIVAQQDLNNFGGSISAGADLQVKAGRDINIESTTQNTQSTMGSRTSIDRVAGLYVSSPNGGIGGTLVASAGRDMHIVAGVVSNSSSGVSSLSAGNNLNLSSATISDQLDIVWNADNYRKSSQGSEIGSVVTGGGGVHLQAGNDLTSVASKLLAKDALSLHATNQVEVLSGHSSAHLDEAYRQTQSSLLSNTTITTHEKQSNSLAIGSSLEANTVNINAKDIHIKGSRVIGDTETTLTAGQSVTIEAATNTINSSRSRNETSSGFMAAEGIRIGFGNQIQSLESNSASSTACKLARWQAQKVMSPYKLAINTSKWVVMY
jgi:filamentous hemagglutinin